ncbi:MAG TPA: thermonuclease family protein [Planctomycetaceae bacterium]|nr:thermonuclease family protein [Planctomycetaceae bacterium]
MARTFVAFCAILSLASFVSAQDRYEEHRERERERERHFLNGRVVQVIDGDTCIIEDRDGRRHRICLYGVDAPENGQPYWKEAREALYRRIYNKEVRFAQVETDSEGRACCNLYLGERPLNVEMVREGFGWHHTEHEPIREFAEAERVARERHLGLWADRHPVEPWKWRKEHREARREHEYERERER